MGLFVFSLSFVFLSSTAFAHAGDLYDGFESESLTKIWSTKRLVPGALKIQHQVVRKGTSAIEITIHPRDRYTPGDGKSDATERDELSETSELMSQLGKAYAYQFSILIPKDFPIVPTRLVLAQWKQDCPRSTCLPDNPVVALRYVGGELYVTVQNSEHKQAVYQTREDVRGRWLDFKFEIRFSPEKNGLLKVWLDDKLLTEFKGPTAYPAVNGYPADARFYFKMGLYRDLMKKLMTVYIDEYRKTELPIRP